MNCDDIKRDCSGQNCFNKIIEQLAQYEDAIQICERYNLEVMFYKDGNNEQKVIVCTEPYIQSSATNLYDAVQLFQKEHIYKDKIYQYKISK